jgi:hypothetical protein
MSTEDEFRDAIAQAEGIDRAEVDARIEANSVTAPTPLPPVTYQRRGGATNFARNGYEVNQHAFPSDLFDNTRAYGGNYTIFYINQLQDSKLKAGDRDVNGNPLEFADPSLVRPSDRGDLVAMGLNTEELTAAVTAQSGIAALVAGGIGAGTVRQVGTAAAINAGGSYVTATMATSATRQTKRLKTAIALHTPNQLQIAYNTQWSEEDTAAFAVTQGIGASIINAMGSGGSMSDIADTGQAGAANLFLSKSPTAGAVSAATGLAANPKKEQLFKGVDFRTFTMEYQFFPRDEQEANNVMNIIRQFKYHMHPEFKDDRNFVYLYPSEFDIYHYKDGRENLNLHRHTSCVLTNMSINYTPNGLYATFPNGMSTQINVALTFKELALLNKEKIMDGM